MKMEANQELSFSRIDYSLSIVFFSVLPMLFGFYYPGFSGLKPILRKGILFPVRIILIPLIAGISYEVLKISDKRQNSLLFKAISMPGLLLQKITTKEPNSRQIEVAIASLKKLLKIEKK